MELGTWSHLTARFFGAATARRLTDQEHREVEAWLDSENESAVYWEQPVIDQRHGLDSARRVGSLRPGRRDLIRAALLHDIGKRHSRLGVFGRSLASFLAKLGRPVRGNRRQYLNHEALGAEDLSRLGAEEIVVEFARHHHGRRPATIREDDWDVLQSADR